MKKHTIKTFHKIFFSLFFGGVILATNSNTASASNTFAVAPDSVGTEILNGNRFVIHKLQAKETYYQLGRMYGVSVKDIMEANNKKNLRIGDQVKIPRGKAKQMSENAPTPHTNNTLIPANTNKTPQTSNQDIFTEYKVGKNETLYAISRRFAISVEDIKKANNLTSNNVREGQLLKIPNESKPEPVVEAVQPIIASIEERQPVDDSEFKGNKYGIRETKENGIGVWMDSFGDGDASLALHKTAPIGTILKITNPMNRSVTFAKVVGKFADNQDTQDAIVVISKSVARSIGVLDRRFQIEINYGAPLEL